MQEEDEWGGGGGGRERRKRDEAAMAVARKEREIQRAKEEAERLVIQVRSTVGMVLREMVDAVAARNGESPPQPPLES